MRLVILGKGGYGNVVYDIAEQSGKYDEIIFLDDNTKDEKVLGKCGDYLNFVNENTELYPAFGNNSLRVEFIEKFKAQNIKVATIISKDAYVSPKAQIGDGCVLLPKCVINTNAVLKDGCLINIGAVVDHDSIISKGCHICIGAVVKGGNHLPENFKLEANQVIERGEII